MKKIMLFLFVIVTVLFNKNYTFGGDMSGLPYSKLKNPEGLFEVELKVVDRNDLPDLIPSAEKPLLKRNVDKTTKEMLDESAKYTSKELFNNPIVKHSSSESRPFGKLLKDDLDKSIGYSGEKYVFGSIRYKNDFDYRVDTSVKMDIYSPNNPNLKVDNFSIRNISTDKAYFLIFIGPVLMDTSDKEVILSYKIEEARAK